MAALGGCAEPSSQSLARDAGTRPALPPAPTPRAIPPAARPALPPLGADERVEVPAGPLRVGSRPGTPDRRPSVEADLEVVEVAGFSIDRLPYPNDPGRPALLVGSREEAAQHCAAGGRRLCHELEWERACRGDEAHEYATGDTLDLAECAADPTACPSPLGVLDLGFREPEWTASDATAPLARLDRTAVARGARGEDPVEQHRCGARQAVTPDGARPMAFRCCAGDAPAPAYPEVGVRRVFVDLRIDEARVREVLREVPELARFASAFRLYGLEDAQRAIARGGATAEQLSWELTPGPLAWAPALGEEVWLLTGRSSGSTLIAAIYPLPDGTFRHAASFVLADEEAPIAILRSRASRAELLWTACHGCAGESGVIRFDDRARIVIAQQ